jgi:hypothetical protein
MQTVTPMLERYAQGTGDMGPLNTAISQWLESLDMDPKGLLMAGPAPIPQPAGNAEAPPGAEGAPGLNVMGEAA